MRRLFIAEKYELAEVIANNLGQSSKVAGHFLCGEDAVAWCSGHMLELYMPEDYDALYEQWEINQLPIIMVPWKYKPIPRQAKQLTVIRKLISQAQVIVHAGDVDAEGQLLVDEVLSYYSVNKPVKRLLINDYNDKLVRKALNNLKDNRKFRGLSQNALARSVADLHWGVNMSRLYSLAAEESGVKANLSVGRVQTPILGLIVNRDRAVENHKASFHYTLEGHFTSDDGLKLSGQLDFPDTIPVDEKGRLRSEEPLRPIQDSCRGMPAKVASTTKETRYTPPPLPYDLLELQADASRKFGYSPAKTLKVTQALREKYKLITYNRSDCRYLSDEKHQEAPDVLAAVAGNAEVLTSAVHKADPGLKSRAFNSANVTAHHAIIPTEARANLTSLSEPEKNLYLLIARAYVAQFWPKKVTDVVTVVVECGGYRFKRSYSALVSAGWSALYKNDRSNEEAVEEESGQVSQAFLQHLEGLLAGTACRCTDAIIEKHQVPAPKHYTESTLLKDLRRVAQYVKDPKVAALLKAKDKGKKGENGGIGTPATRDSFIETLKKRDFIKANGKKLVSTALGRAFYDVLPDVARQPDMTALWHEQQMDIEQGRLTVDHFLNELVETIRVHVEEVRASGLDASALQKARHNAEKQKPVAEATDFSCRACGKPLLRRPSLPRKGASKASKKKASFWYGCSGYPDCRQTYPEYEGRPDYDGSGKPQSCNDTQAGKVGQSCPQCSRGTLTKRSIKSGPNQGKPFIGCNGFPKCKFFRWYG